MRDHQGEWPIMVACQFGIARKDEGVSGRCHCCGDVIHWPASNIVPGHAVLYVCKPCAEVLAVGMYAGSPAWRRLIDRRN